ncbi:sensory histidine kinase CreC [Actinomadura rubteroloni]|uniref:histidine kinase n=1 Tax=Actinomadura rubteroloni TaxID=1926885 RepID=A0A2P4UI68_9ACTN|nr:nitrate- and nitrite sensing domain-containing protein [Actinomadura rubteroloni]POM24726.1 sensory histidine kinase CreC [Actinomadura rubteroloni]
MKGRLSSIRARITLLTLVPLLALGGLWVFATGITYGEADQLLRSRTFEQKSLLPTQGLVAALQRERRLSMWRAGAGRVTRAEDAELAARRRETDQVREKVRTSANDSGLRDLAASRPALLSHIDALVRGLGALGAIRRDLDTGRAVRADVLREYDGMIDAAFGVYSSVVAPDGRITSDARALTAIGRAHEYVAREDALLTGALAAGRLTGAERADFAQLVGAQRYTYLDAVPNLPGPDRARYGRLVAGPEFARLRLWEDEIVRGARTVQPAGGRKAARTPAAREPLTVRQWWSTADAVEHGLYEFENATLSGVTKRATDIAVGAFARLAIAGGLGLLAVIASALLAYRVGRRLLRECRTLADAVVDFAHRKLPDLSARVRSGETVDPEDVDLSTPDFTITEIERIAAAFVVTRDAVLLAAAGEIAARRGISEVFVNLARRNQSLLHHQLSLLDRMEHRTEDPAELADLFRLDHLATRMRRHAEGLVILAGKTAGRGWRHPVPLVDVVRGAVAEVEDYPRVRVRPLPRVALLGTAVADVVHLLAEVVENATAFSPPGSPVVIDGHRVGQGCAIEIEDRGLGMEEAAIAAANARLADPPEFDPSDSAQLGLFVVARLARRHGIRVTLRASAYGGVTAIALIPGELLVAVPEPEPAARRSGPLALTPGPAMAVAAERAEKGVVRLVAEPVADEPEPEPEPAPVAERPAVHEATDAGLPRRRRQANLAPALRERLDAQGDAGTGRHRAPVAEAPVPLAAPVADDAAPPQEPPRSPEAMRSKLSAMQRGWERGRSEPGPAPDEPIHPEEDETR